MIKLIIAELGRPDDQGRDWYGWASNQLSHAFIGLVLAIHFGFVASVATACLKELIDLIKKPASIMDSVTDVVFWSLGAWMIYASDKVLVTILILFALTCGVIPRVRKIRL